MRDGGIRFIKTQQELGGGIGIGPNKSRMAGLGSFHNKSGIGRIGISPQQERDGGIGMGPQQEQDVRLGWVHKKSGMARFG